MNIIKTKNMKKTTIKKEVKKTPIKKAVKKVERKVVLVTPPEPEPIKISVEVPVGKPPVKVAEPIKVEKKAEVKPIAKPVIKYLDEIVYMGAKVKRLNDRDTSIQFHCIVNGGEYKGHFDKTLFIIK